MTLHELIRRKIDLMAPGESVHLTRDALKSWLEAYPEPSPVERDENPPANGLKPKPLNTAEVGETFSRSRNTINGWVRAGVFGDPESLKPNGQRTEIPPQRVREVQEKFEQGYRITASGLQAPAGTAQDAGVGSAEAGSSGADTRRTPPKVSPAPEPGGSTAHGQYGGWREREE